MVIDATFWVAISFIIFFGVLIYFKIPQKVLEMLDKMISDIKNEIDESEKLRTEAKTLLDSSQKKLDTAQSVSNEILENAKKDADKLIIEMTEKFHKSSEIKKNLTENSKQKIFVAGHNGMVGSAIFRILKKNEKLEILVKNKSELDLSNQSKVNNFLKKEKPSQIYICAAKVGGILANSTYPVDFLYSNMMIQNNLINGAFENGIKKILFLGSSCIYPKYSKQPIEEESLLSGILEPTNEPYAIAKIAGIKLCDSYNRQFGKKYGIDYRSVMPTNLYGYGDNYDLKDSHVIPGLIKKFHLAKTLKKKKVFVWGTGKPKREFLHFDDLAKACVHVMSLTKKVLSVNL